MLSLSSFSLKKLARNGLLRCHPICGLKSKILKCHIGMHDKARFSEVSLCLGIIKNKSFDKCVRYLQGSVCKDQNLEVPCSPEKSVPSTHYVLSLDILYVP